MRYLIIPELHKSGRIHFHGVFSDVKNWSLSPAINPYTGESIIENNKQVYNLDNYKLGYTTVSKVENIEAVSHYISKYITKELLNLKSKKNVWHSRNLIKPQMTYHLADLSDISNYIDSNNYNIDYKSEKAQENYEKRYYSVSSYNIYYVNFPLLSLFSFNIIKSMLNIKGIQNTIANIYLKLPFTGEIILETKIANKLIIGIKYLYLFFIITKIILNNKNQS